MSDNSILNIKKGDFGKAFRAAFPHTIPVLTGFLVLGTAYGILMRTKGLGTLTTVGLSALAFCGSMQFVAITLLTAAFDPVQAFLLSLMVNTRHIFYGISMLEKYKGLGKIRAFLILTLCDETFSVSSSISPPEGISRKYFFLNISLLIYLYWVIGSLIGSLLGNFIKFNTEGLDFVLTALFVVLFLEQMKSRDNRIFGIIGIACTVFARVVFGSANLVIPAMIFMMIVLFFGRKKRCK